MNYIPHELQEAVKDRVVDSALFLVQDRQQSAPLEVVTRPQPQADPDAPSTSATSTSHAGSGSLFAGIIAAGVSEDPNTQSQPQRSATRSATSTREQVRRELSMYLDDPMVTLDVDDTDRPLLYWSSKLRMWPILSRTAVAYLSCPPSSVTSERMFSMAGNILSKKRCAMSPKNLNYLAIIKVNRHFIR